MCVGVNVRLVEWHRSKTMNQWRDYTVLLNQLATNDVINKSSHQLPFSGAYGTQLHPITLINSTYLNITIQR